MVLEEFLMRTWEELVAQLIGAFLFRLILQPTVSVAVAIRSPRWRR